MFHISYDFVLSPNLLPHLHRLARLSPVCCCCLGIHMGKTWGGLGGEAPTFLGYSLMSLTWPLFWGVPLLVWLLTAFLGLGFETLPIITALEHFKKTFNLHFILCAHMCVCVPQCAWGGQRITFPSLFSFHHVDASFWILVLLQVSDKNLCPPGCGDKNLCLPGCGDGSFCPLGSHINPWNSFITFFSLAFRHLIFKWCVCRGGGTCTWEQVTNGTPDLPWSCYTWFEFWGAGTGNQTPVLCKLCMC